MNWKAKIGGVVLALLTGSAAAAGVVTSEPFGWHPSGAMDWVDMSDDSSTGVTDLGFDFMLDGQVYRYFDMDSNGYVELLAAAGDSPSGASYGGIDDLTSNYPDHTFVLAAYDDLSSSSYGYFGYALHGDHAVFNWTTETFDDEDYGLLNIFQVVLESDGSVRWNFLDAGYESYSYDLFSGLYLGNTGELIEVVRDDIPVLASYRYSPVPVPAAAWLFGSGLLGMVAVARRRRARRG